MSQDSPTIEEMAGRLIEAGSIETRLTELGRERQRIGRRAMQFRAVAQKVADDIVAEETDLCAHCDGEAYSHAVKELRELMVTGMDATLTVWQMQREAAQ